MTKANPWLVAVLAVCTMSMGLWGCTQQKTGAFNAKVREMEARYAKLEEDYRAVAAAADQGRKKLALAEARLSQAKNQNGDLTKQVEELRPVAAERDDLRKQLTTRTGERDQIVNQMTQFSKELQALAGRLETVASAGGVGPAVVATPASRKSE